jgi:hypothetical protein
MANQFDYPTKPWWSGLKVRTHKQNKEEWERWKAEWREESIRLTYPNELDRGGSSDGC